MNVNSIAVEVQNDPFSKQDKDQSVIANSVSQKKYKQYLKVLI